MFLKSQVCDLQYEGGEFTPKAPPEFRLSLGRHSFGNALLTHISASCLMLHGKEERIQMVGGNILLIHMPTFFVTADHRSACMAFGTWIDVQNLNLMGVMCFGVMRAGPSWCYLDLDARRRSVGF